ncbi:MAG: sialidase family protein [Gemmataceae bacterium]
MTAILMALFFAAAAAPEADTVPVFVPATDGFKSIRIPAVVATMKGTLLAFAEGRTAERDQAQNQLLLKRSTDGGKTWSARAIIAGDGRHPHNNPCAVVDPRTGRVLLIYQTYPPDLAERSKDLATGHTGERIVRNWLIHSDDDGLTWSAPRDITPSTKRPTGATTLASGPGIGIVLRRGPHAGRILIPMNEGPYGLWNVYAAYSDDHGATWQTGANAPKGIDPTPGKKDPSFVNEVQFVELNDGSVRLNARRWSGKPVRKTSVSRDGGSTWSDVADVPEQPDPSCMGSILRYAEGEAKSPLYYTGPRGPGRTHGTLYRSTDDGATWPVKLELVPGPFAYSCLVTLPGGAGLGVLYEADGMKTIAFRRLSPVQLERMGK